VPAPVNAVFDTLSTAGDTAAANTSVVLDNIGGIYANATALQAALTTLHVGDITLAGTGVAANTTADLLIGYQQSPSSIAIADVTIAAGAAAVTDTAMLGTGSLAVTDLVHITTTVGFGLANFTPHNVHFFA